MRIDNNSNNNNHNDDIIIKGTFYYYYLEIVFLVPIISYEVRSLLSLKLDLKEVEEVHLVGFLLIPKIYVSGRLQAIETCKSLLKDLHQNLGNTAWLHQFRRFHHLPEEGLIVEQ